MNIAPDTAAGRRSSAAASSAVAFPDPGLDRRVYEALCADPAPLDELVRLTGLDLAELCGGLERLARAGLARDAGGWW